MLVLGSHLLLLSLMGGVLCENVGSCRPLLLVVDQAPFLGKRVERETRTESPGYRADSARILCVFSFFSVWGWEKTGAKWTGASVTNNGLAGIERSGREI